MSSIVIKNARLADDPEIDGLSSVQIEDGLIAAVGSNVIPGSEHQAIDAGGATVFPGFIDVHIHGAVGIDVNEADADGLVAIASYLAGHGVTAWVPTLVPDSDKNYRRTIGEIDRLMDMQNDLPIAEALGVHYEGVFASGKMCGALRSEYFKTFTGNEVDQLPRLKRGVHMTTLAPEIGGGVELVRELAEKGWVASIGHTAADVATLDAAFAAGAKHMTHFFNAMTGVHHREIGVAGWGLANPAVTFDIIADGIHVHPRMLELACRTKSPSGVTLISDSVAPTGLGDGEFPLWGEMITVENGRTRNERGSIAGSMITMLDAVNRILSLGFSTSEVSMMASLNPARLLGLDHRLGSIEVGRSADLVALDEKGNVRMTMIKGNIVGK